MAVKVDSPVSGTIRGKEVPDFVDSVLESQKLGGFFSGPLSAQIGAEPNLG